MWFHMLKFNLSLPTARCELIVLAVGRSASCIQFPLILQFISIAATCMSVSTVASLPLVIPSFQRTVFHLPRITISSTE